MTAYIKRIKKKNSTISLILEFLQYFFKEIQAAQFAVLPKDLSYLIQH